MILHFNEKSRQESICNALNEYEDRDERRKRTVVQGNACMKTQQSMTTRKTTIRTITQSKETEQDETPCSF